MAEYFDTPQQADAFIAENFERKERNLICGRIRMSRKANQQKWNYFVTFTYDDALHTEDSFRESLMNQAHTLSSKGNENTTVLHIKGNCLSSLFCAFRNQ